VLHLVDVKDLLLFFIKKFSIFRSRFLIKLIFSIDFIIKCEMTTRLSTHQTSSHELNSKQSRLKLQKEFKQLQTESFQLSLKIANLSDLPSTRNRNEKKKRFLKLKLLKTQMKLLEEKKTDLKLRYEAFFPWLRQDFDEHKFKLKCDQHRMMFPWIKLSNGDRTTLDKLTCNLFDTVLCIPHVFEKIIDSICLSETKQSTLKSTLNTKQNTLAVLLRSFRKTPALMNSLMSVFTMHSRIHLKPLHWTNQIQVFRPPCGFHRCSGICSKSAPCYHRFSQVETLYARYLHDIDLCRVMNSIMTPTLLLHVALMESSNGKRENLKRVLMDFLRSIPPPALTEAFMSKAAHHVFNGPRSNKNYRPSGCPPPMKITREFLVSVISSLWSGHPLIVFLLNMDTEGRFANPDDYFWVPRNGHTKSGLRLKNGALKTLDLEDLASYILEMIEKFQTIYITTENCPIGTKTGGRHYIGMKWHQFLAKMLFMKPFVSEKAKMKDMRKYCNASPRSSNSVMKVLGNDYMFVLHDLNDKLYCAFDGPCRLGQLTTLEELRLTFTEELQRDDPYRLFNLPPEIRPGNLLWKIFFNNSI
jgi:hypothetical protein